MPVPTLKPQTFTASKVLSLFTAYADPDDTSVIGPEGFEQLCTDASIAMDGAKPLILAWLLDAGEMGKFKKEEWVKGLGDLQ